MSAEWYEGKAMTYDEAIQSILDDPGSFAAELELMGLSPDEIESGMKLIREANHE